MSHIVIERGEGSLVDRFRIYKVLIDGELRGTIRQKEKWAFAVPAGTHTVAFRINWYESPPIKVVVVSRTRLVCKSSAAHAFGLLSLLSPKSWISVREEDAAPTLELACPGDSVVDAARPVRGPLAAGQLAMPPAKQTPGASYRIAGPDTDDAMQARRVMELDLREAVAARTYDILYQPQIDMRTQRVTKFEAQLRWVHPAHGLVPPAVFIPMAEELGLSAEVGRQVLLEACRVAATWPADIALSIIITRQQLNGPAVLPIVLAALAQTGLPPQRLVLEIPEDVVMGGDLVANATIVALREAGIGVAIDGFGVAYASLSYLPETVFDRLKISGSIVQGLGTAHDRIGIVRAAVGLCDSLGMTCCAVGVETAEQAATLLSEGCSLAQGKLFGAPLTAREVHAVVERIHPCPTDRSAVAALPKAALSFFQVVESVNDIVIITTAALDAGGPVIVYVNPAFTRLTGYSAAEAIGQTPRMLQGPGTDRATLDVIRDSLAAGLPVRQKVLNFGKNGAPYWLDLQIVPLRGAGGATTHFVGIQRDVTMDQQRLDELEFLVDRDRLTGIPNGRKLTRAVDAQIARALASDAPLGDTLGPCVGFIGINGFQDLQNELGDAAGDAILRGMAGRLAEVVRRCDTVCRISGEIFAICLPSVSHDDADLIVARLCRSMAAHGFATPAGLISTTSSYGIAAFEPGDSATGLIQRADAAMHAAKRAQSTEQSVAAA